MVSNTAQYYWTFSCNSAQKWKEDTEQSVDRIAQHLPSYRLSATQ